MADILASVRTKLRDTAAFYGQPDAYVHLRPVEVDDGAGGTIETLATVGTGTCRLSTVNLQAQLQIVSSQVTETVPYQIAVPWGTGVEPQDQFVIGGRTFRVEAVVQSEALGFETYLSCVEVL